MQHHAAIGCDVGGTSCKLGLVDAAGRIIGRTEFGVTNAAGINAFLSSLFKALDRMMAGTSELVGVGMLLPGYLNRRRTVPRIMVNLRMLENVPLAHLLEERYRLKIVLDIDRNGPARAESLLRTESRESRLMYVTIGTGLGVGFAVRGRVCRVANGSIGELGHITLEETGIPCACGNAGCVETLVSRDGIGRVAERLGLCGEILASSGTCEFPRALCSVAARGDRDALRVFEEFGRYLGIALTSYANTFSPDAIVIGGGLSAASDFFLPSAKRWLDAHWLERATKNIQLRRTTFGIDAGIVGAASLVLSQTRNPESAG